LPRVVEVLPHTFIGNARGPSNPTCGARRAAYAELHDRDE
jgi:hypothetical protein